MRFAFMLSLSLVTLGLLQPLQCVAEEADIDAIRELQTRQADAWNRQDATAYSELFLKDGDVVNVMGWWWRGRDRIRERLSEAFTYVFSESELTITDVHVRMLSPSIAVAHVRWTLDGAKSPPGAPAPPREGIQLQVLQKQNDAWHIVSFQNTNSLPEASFPQRP